jgi:GPI mannosyltransferase 1 subunit M
VVYLYTFVAGYIKTAGAVYGLAVHWRIYPIAYSLPLLRHLALKSQTHSGSLQGRRTLSSSNKKSMLTTIQQLMLNLVSLKGFEFGTCAAGIFFLLGIGMHKMCGWAFLQETYLYHAMRIDPRHNFSPFFYPAYLMHGGGTVSYRGLNMPYPTAATLSQWMTRIVGDSGW